MGKIGDRDWLSNRRDCLNEELGCDLERKGLWNGDWVRYEVVNYWKFRRWVVNGGVEYGEYVWRGYYWF